jgi:hypothetical protein
LPKSRREDCAILSPDIQKGSPAGAEACNEPVCDDVICPKSGLLGIAKLHGSEREILLDSQQGLPERRTESSTFQRISHQQNPEFHLCSQNRSKSNHIDFFEQTLTNRSFPLQKLRRFVISRQVIWTAPE